MRKWEEKYEKLKNGDFDARIDELKTKIDDKKATREEFKEYQKLEKSKGNINKVKNVIEFRQKTELDLKDIQNELKLRQDLKKAEQKSLEIGLELMQIEKEFENIDKELKDKNLAPEKRMELENRKNELKGKRDDNNKKYLENQNVLKSGLGRNEKFKNYSNDELKDLESDTKSKISKCNMVANNLVNGLSWDSIDLKLSNWNKLTNKDSKLSKKDKPEDREEDKPEVEIEGKPEVETEGKPENSEEGQSRLSKIANWFKEKGENLKDKYPLIAKMSTGIGKLFKKEGRLPEAKPETKPETKPEVNPEVNRKLDSDKSFNEYIKFVAEYGEKNAKYEQLKANKDLQQKRQAIQKANREEEAEKYGGRYDIDDGSR